MVVFVRALIFVNCSSFDNLTFLVLSFVLSICKVLIGMNRELIAIDVWF